MLNLASSRSRQARMAVLLSGKLLRLSLFIVSLASLGLWFYSVWILRDSLGNLLLIIFAFASMLLLWYVGHLRDLPIDKTSQTIDSRLAWSVLGRLRGQPSPRDLAEVVTKLPGGLFFGARFGVGRDFIIQLSSAAPTDSDMVWEYAAKLSDKAGEESISEAAVFAALVYSLPEYNFYLSQLGLDSDDIEDGLKWHTHIQSLISEHKTKKNAGGLGRDLGFGWTPLLSRIGIPISQHIEAGGVLHRKVSEHEDVLTQMIHLLQQQGRRNVTLVGEVGTGKTTLVYALAQRLMKDKRSSGSLAYQQVFELDSSSLIAQTKGRGEIEQLLIRVFNEALKAKNAIIFLDDAQLFLKDGTGSVDLSNILLPILEGGALKLILSMSDQQWLELSQSNPGLTQLMNRVVVSPLNKDATMRVAEDQVLLLESRHKITYMYQSLHEAYKLSGRYIREQAFPGKMIKLLDSAAGFPEQQYFVTANSVRQAVEKNFDVKVQVADTTEERDTLLNLEGKIHDRMINQTRAVQVVSDALRRARSGVRNQDRPIGTFLFLGPTGVGKTELSKALAEVYFGGEDRMIRLDLNEYSMPEDTKRLIASPAEFPDSLTARISKQPFSVVLLDEIEKAHDSVLSVLLQMLDEGVLRDSDNKEVSFRDAIIIATSNAGASSIREHIEKGQQLEDFEQQFIDELISSGDFRPEFLNRFDEIVLFRPLTEKELEQVVDLILRSINKSLSSQKVTVTLTDDAKSFLASEGYDPRLGARPLRRVMQRSIENIMAKKLLDGSVNAGDQVTISADQIKSSLGK